MLTTNHVVGETWTFLRRRAGHAYGTAFLDRIETLRSGHGLVVTHVTEDLGTTRNALAADARRTKLFVRGRHEL